MATRSPAFREETPSPTCCTTPAELYPSIRGKGTALPPGLTLASPVRLARSVPLLMVEHSMCTCTWPAVGG